MTAPNGITLVTMTGTLVDDTGSPLTGGVNITPSVSQVVSAADELIIELTPKRIQLDSSGSFSVDLVPSSSSNDVPTGITWTLQPVNAPGTSITFAVPADTDTADISQYVVGITAPPAPSYYIGFRGPQGDPGPAGDASDPTVASFIATDGTATKAALDSQYEALVPRGTAAPGSVPVLQPDGSMQFGTGGGGGGGGSVFDATATVKGVLKLAGDLGGTADFPEVVSGANHTHTLSTLPEMTAIGQQLSTSINAAAARSAIGAGTSSLVIGTTSTTAKSGNYTPGYADLPAGTTITVLYNVSTGWPVRPTSRSDIVVAWKGPDPSPTIVPSGTGGMLDNVDYRLVTP